MKRLLLLVLLVFVFVSPAFADRYWGAKIGFNVGTFTGDDADPTDLDAETRNTRGGFYTGAFVDFEIFGPIGLRTELNYSGKGVEYEGGDSDILLRLNTLELPILLDINLPLPIPLVDISIFGGPAVGYVFSSRYEYSEPGYSEEGSAEDNGITVATLDIAAAAGLGTAIKAGPGRVYIDIRYTFGLLSVVDEVDISEPEIALFVDIPDPIIRTSTVGVMVGYGIAF